MFKRLPNKNLLAANKYILHLQKKQYFYKPIKSIFHSLVFTYTEEKFFVCAHMVWKVFDAERSGDENGRTKAT